MKKILLFGIILFLVYNFIGIKGIIYLLLIYFIFFFVYKKKYYIKLITGQTGAGKTLLANHYAQKYISKGKNVYTTFCCQGAKKLPVNFYDFKYPKDSLLILDEAQIGLDSREFNRLVKSGASNKLLAMLSMHRHNKLDIFCISQDADEIDVRVRRYCNEFIVIKNIIFFRRFSLFLKKKLHFKTFICPLLIRQEVWPRYKDYERWLNNSAELSPREYGARYRWSLTLKKSYDTYSTYQEDSFYQSLPSVCTDFWKDKGELLDTGKSK